MDNTIVSAGHLCLDITPVFPGGNGSMKIDNLLSPGKLLHMEGVDVHTGGSVANTGIALKILGNNVKLLGKIGNDSFGKIVKGIVESYGAGGLIEDESSSTSYTVVLAVPGYDRIFLHDPGANDNFSNEDIPEKDLDDAVLFHFGYPPLMRRMYADCGSELTEMFRRMKSKGIATSLDLAAVDLNSDAGRADWEAILRSVLPYVDFFVPSFEELCLMLDKERYERLNHGGDITEGLDLREEVLPLEKKALAMGCRAILVKCGTSGMAYKTADTGEMRDIGRRLHLDYAAWGGKEGFQPCFKADAVRSGTGAGDTSIAAFLTAVLHGYGPAECTALSAAEGACSVTTFDALSGLKPLDELMARIKSGWKTIGA